MLSVFCRHGNVFSVMATYYIVENHNLLTCYGGLAFSLPFRSSTAPSLMHDITACSGVANRPHGCNGFMRCLSVPSWIFCRGGDAGLGGMRVDQALAQVVHEVAIDAVYSSCEVRTTVDTDSSNCDANPRSC